MKARRILLGCNPFLTLLYWRCPPFTVVAGMIVLGPIMVAANLACALANHLRRCVLVVFLIFLVHDEGAVGSSPSSQDRHLYDVILSRI